MSEWHLKHYYSAEVRQETRNSEIILKNNIFSLVIYNIHYYVIQVSYTYLNSDEANVKKKK